LNDDFQGGDFKLYNPNEYTLNKVIGNAYIFDARIDHEITPVLNGERYSLLWFLQKDHLTKKTII
jgi:predicted 2-oxoglutarate/Fe(II)-dependent dioxygenase YbiX